MDLTAAGASKTGRVHIGSKSSACACPNPGRTRETRAHVLVVSDNDEYDDKYTADDGAQAWMRPATIAILA